MRRLRGAGDADPRTGSTPAGGGPATLGFWARLLPRTAAAWAAANLPVMVPAIAVLLLSDRVPAGTAAGSALGAVFLCLLGTTAGAILTFPLTVALAAAGRPGRRATAIVYAALGAAMAFGLPAAATEGAAGLNNALVLAPAGLIAGALYGWVVWPGFRRAAAAPGR